MSFLMPGLRPDIKNPLVTSRSKPTPPPTSVERRSHVLFTHGYPLSKASTSPVAQIYATGRKFADPREMRARHGSRSSDGFCDARAPAAALVPCGMPPARGRDLGSGGRGGWRAREAASDQTFARWRGRGALTTPGQAISRKVALSFCLLGRARRGIARPRASLRAAGLVRRSRTAAGTCAQPRRPDPRAERGRRARAPELLPWPRARLAIGRSHGSRHDAGKLRIALATAERAPAAGGPDACPCGDGASDALPGRRRGRRRRWGEGGGQGAPGRTSPSAVARGRRWRRGPGGGGSSLGGAGV